jgi:hypothetical protein
MPDTTNLGLPLVQPAQSQKHITVNEALARLDALVLLRLQSTDVSQPPAAPVDGAAWGVPAAASGAWAGQSGRIAIFLNGGWEFVAPRRGWRAHVADRSCEAVWDGLAWLPGANAVSAGGAMTGFEILEADVPITAGTSVTSTVVIPANAVVIGVTARVVATIVGTLQAWRLGVAEDLARYGSGLGLGAGSFALGVGGTPTTIYTSTPVVLSATGGSFAAGTVRVAAHLLRIGPPR